MNASLKTRKNVVTFFTYLVLILGSISMIFPFVWMVLTSFKTQAESMAIPPQILPSHWNLDSFVKALQSLPFTNLYINTGLLILFRVIFAVVFSSMAGYAFAKLEFPCKKLLFSLVLIQMMLPSQIFIIPQYQMLAKMGATNSMLGVYALAERLTQGFPEVLFEGCAGGGGRFDAGMLCYYPQIWCSDDTDAIERLTIQHGTSFGYPVCTMGAHVSACPNHQTGRTTPIDTRAVVAMSGTFGYELDLGKLKRTECTAVKNQIKRFKRLNDLIRTGDYYRLTDPAENGYFTAWQFAAEDGSEALLNLVVTHPQANPLPIHLCFRGLEEDAVYELDGIDYFGSQYAHDGGNAREDGIHKGMRFSGSTLLYAGLVLPQLFGDYPSVQLHLTRKG